MLSKERLEAAFKMFDTVYFICYLNNNKDNSGAISVDELKNHFGGDKFSDEIWKKII